MLAQDATVHMTNGTCRARFGRDLFRNKLAIVLIGNKTDFIAVRLVGCAQVVPAGNFTDFGFGEVAKRK